MAVVQPTHLFLFCFVDRWNMRVLSKSHPLSDLLHGTLFPFSLKTYWNKLDHIAEEYIRFLSEPTTNIKTYCIKSSQSPKDNITYCTSDECPGEPDNNIWIYTIQFFLSNAFSIVALGSLHSRPKCPMCTLACCYSVIKYRCFVHEY